MSRVSLDHDKVDQSASAHLRTTRQRGEKERGSKGENSKEKLHVQNRTRGRERERERDGERAMRWFVYPR